MEYQICLFEDEGYKNLLPLSFLRPVYDLRCGMLTLREKVKYRYKTDKLILHSRKTLANCLRESKTEQAVNKFEEDGILFINGRVLVNENFVNAVSPAGSDALFIKDDILVAARLSKDNLKKFVSDNPELISSFDKINCEKINFDADLLEYPWQFVNRNGEEIKNDINLLKPENISSSYTGVHLIDKNRIFIGDDSVIKPNVTIDASEGPVYIGKNVKVLPNTYIQGPVYIGDNSLIKANTQIYEDTSIGPVCKVGGEIENSIIHSYSNKQHDGFLGHSYLGSWVNIGASSNTSDLKNNYGNIRVTINGKEIKTGLQFVGLIMGDHSKCGINTMFNTGTVVGISCNLYGGDFPPKYIPSFSWGGASGLTEYDLRKAIEVAKVVKSRRNVSMNVADLELFRKVFEETGQERKDLFGEN